MSVWQVGDLAHFVQGQPGIEPGASVVIVRRDVEPDGKVSVKFQTTIFGRPDRESMWHDPDLCLRRPPARCPGGHTTGPYGDCSPDFCAVILPGGAE